MPVSFNHTLQFSLDVISHRDSLKGYPRSLFLVRNSWSHTAGSQPQPCTCCQDHGHPPSWHSSSCSFIGSCCCCSTHTSSSHISVFCNSLPGQNLPALFGKCVSNNHLQCKFCWCWVFFLTTLSFSFQRQVDISAGLGHPDYSVPVCQITGQSLSPRIVQVLSRLHVGPAWHLPGPRLPVLSQKAISCWSSASYTRCSAPAQAFFTDSSKKGPQLH